MKVKINGEIIPNEYAWIYDFFGVDHFCPALLEAALDEADPEDRELILEINSPGGYVFAGFETYSRLQQLQREGWTVEAHVMALAASAATTIMSACRTVLCSPVAQIMIHLPIMDTVGNRMDHRDSIDILKSLEESILNGYEMKSNGKATREQLQRAMEKSTWMPAQQAIELGLVDGILGDNGSMLVTYVDVGKLAGSVVNSLQEGFDLSYEEMLARYEKGVLDGVLEQHPLHPVTGQKDDQTEPFLPDGYMDEDLEMKARRKVRWDEGWQQKARLEIERERFRQ